MNAIKGGQGGVSHVSLELSVLGFSSWDLIDIVVKLKLASIFKSGQGAWEASKGLDRFKLGSLQTKQNKENEKQGES